MTNEKEAQYTEGLEYHFIESRGGNNAYYAVAGIGTATDTVIRIPPEHNGQSICRIDHDAFINCGTITEVIFPSNVHYEAIGLCAFQNCFRLESITMPNELDHMEYKAFSGCCSLKSVHISSIASWCKISFDGEESNPLYYAQNLYLNNAPISDVTIPKGIRFIDKNAFVNCRNLTGLSFPNGFRSIGQSAFAGCINLQKIRWPEEQQNESTKHLLFVAENAFDGCCHVLDTENDITYLDMYLISCSHKVTHPIIREGTKYICDKAFDSCNKMKEIDIPDSVRYIGFDAFSHCNALEKVKLPQKPMCIEHAFLKSKLNRDDSDLYVDNWLFTTNGKHRFGRLKIRNGTFGIAGLAWLVCFNKIKTVIVPRTVEYIGSGAFSSTRLRKIVYEGTIAEWEAIHKADEWNNRFGSTPVICSDGKWTAKKE